MVCVCMYECYLVFVSFLEEQLAAYWLPWTCSRLPLTLNGRTKQWYTTEHKDAVKEEQSLNHMTQLQSSDGKQSVFMCADVIVPLANHNRWKQEDRNKHC